MIRSFRQDDALSLRAVFYSSVRFLANQDYTAEQLAAWAPDKYDPMQWYEKLRQLAPFVAEMDGNIVGYADLQHDGLIDHFFVGAPYALKGVGSALMTHILAQAKAQDIPQLYSHVSLTARPFFSRWGFDVMAQCTVNVRGVMFNNFLMQRRVTRSYSPESPHS